MKRARELLRAGGLQTRDIATLDALLFSCGRYGADSACISYQRLRRRLSCCTQSVVDSIARLVTAGLIAKQKQSRWIVAGGRRHRRQMPNIYRFIVPTGDSTGQRVIRELEARKTAQERKTRAMPPMSPALVAALARLGAAVFGENGHGAPSG